MEADCTKEELYRYFGRTTDAPSKAAFYKQRKKLTADALANLLYIFNSKLPEEPLPDSTGSNFQSASATVIKTKQKPPPSLLYTIFNRRR